MTMSNRIIEMIIRRAERQLGRPVRGDDLGLIAMRVAIPAALILVFGGVAGVIGIATIGHMIFN